MDIPGVPAPVMDWDASNLPEAWRKFKLHVSLMFSGPFKAKEEEERCSYLLLWVGDKVCKTPWYNQDYSGETGDYEMLDMISAANPGEICDLPLGIEVQTVDGKPYTSTGETIAVMDIETGFICKNDDQKGGGCSDYKVRFICPLDFCKTKE
nr:cartilage intermediate layer protein 1-like [Syngnathus scovelli]